MFIPLKSHRKVFIYKARDPQIHYEIMLDWARMRIGRSGLL